MNVALARVLYAHALVGRLALALGRLAPLGRLLGDPRLGMAGVFLSLRRVLPDRYPLTLDVEHYIADEQRLGRMLDYAVIVPRLQRLYEWSAADLGEPRLRDSSATAARSTPGRSSSDTFGALRTCHSPPGCSNASRARAEGSPVCRRRAIWPALDKCFVRGAAPWLRFAAMSDAMEIKRAEERWNALRTAEELHAIHAENMKLRNDRDRIDGKLPVPESDRGAAVEVRFVAAVALQAAKRSHTP